METLLLIFVFINVLVNIWLTNALIKDREVISAFVNASHLYANAYNAMATKYNYVGNAFNEMKETTNNQAELLESILSGQIPVAILSPEALQRPKESKKRSKSTKPPAT